MKAALLLVLSATLFSLSRASAVDADHADCPALMGSRNPGAARVAAIVSRADTDGRSNETPAAKAAESRSSGALMRSLVQIGQKKSDGLIVSDSTNCRVALNATYGKVTPVTARGWTTMVVVTW